MSAATLVQYVTEFAEIAETEYDESVHGSADETPDVLAIILAAIRNHRADLATLARKVETDLMAIAGEKRFVVEGLGEVAIKTSMKRTEWDNEGLTRKLVALALDERILDTETGEYESSHEAVARVLSECARPTWRLTPLRARHIPLDEYCVETFDGYAVALPPRQT